VSAVEVPEVVRNKARVAGSDQWLLDLPDLVELLGERWALVPQFSYPDATEALVLAVTRADGRPAVLKLVVPGHSQAAQREATALRLAGGRGLAELFAADETCGALLLERLGPSLKDLGLPVQDRHRVLCATAQDVWRPARGHGLPTGAEKAGQLIDFIVTAWEELDRPCTEAAVAHAVRCAEGRIDAWDEERSVLVHGDVHQWNALAALDGFKLVDPDGLLAEPEYDLGIIMREDPEELMAESDPMDRASRLAALTGRNASAIWEWGVVERVSTGLLGTKVGLQPVARQMLQAADQIAMSKQR
jgi:streptomycin 6-kinase